jgi:hypothetical protein
VIFALSVYHTPYDLMLPSYNWPHPEQQRFVESYFLCQSFLLYVVNEVTKNVTLARTLSIHGCKHFL